VKRESRRKKQIAEQKKGQGKRHNIYVENLLIHYEGKTTTQSSKNYCFNVKVTKFFSTDN
jgi:hypothetical protein